MEELNQALALIERASHEIQVLSDSRWHYHHCSAIGSASSFISPLQQGNPSPEAQKVLLSFQEKSNPYELCKYILGSSSSLCLLIINLSITLSPLI